MKKMKFQKKSKPFKKCPRCGNKCLANQEKCEECGLLFSKLQFASNKAAKKKLAHFDRDYVIFTNQLPADVSKVKLWIYLILFGWVGGHYYYVGKYMKGLFMSLGFVYLVVGTIFNAQIVAANATLLYLPIAIYALSWVVSFSFVLSRRFRVPIYFDESLLQAEKDSAREEYDRVSQQIRQENEKLKKNKELNKDAKNKSETRDVSDKDASGKTLNKKEAETKAAENKLPENNAVENKASDNKIQKNKMANSKKDAKVGDKK